ncbi:hypothetical protein [Iodidimonas sp. SYSU 1G8]|uniref:hypothetical protein n=1 Tax=Iodidimonas sp. SYSU 1G8 TaxID=3133967 RepID=UPI0031FECCF5
MNMYAGQRMSFKRDKVYHDILSERHDVPEAHLIVSTPLRWAAGLAALTFYGLITWSLYWVSNVGFRESADPSVVPVWRHFLGLVLNTSAIGFSAIFLVSLVLWAARQASPRYPFAFGSLGFIAGLLIATVL